MKKKHAITITAVLAASMAMSVTAFGAPTDIQGHWAQNTINKWVDKGDISGYPDGTFRPNNMITRAEFVVLVNNAMGYTKSGYAYFSDVPSHYWGKNAIQTGVAAGYISGDGNGIFRPNDPVTRQEAAAMISRILDLKQNESRAYRYTDSYAISNWAKGVVGAVSDAGIMAGYPDGSFGPNRVLTRAEAVLALDKTVNYKPSDKEEDKEETQKEDMLLTQSKLEDTTITGDLTISDRLGTKTITLEDVTVKGKLIVDGGGEIILKDCDIIEMVMDQKDTAVKASGKTTVEKTTFKKIGKLTGGDYTDVIVDKELSGYITIDAKVRNLTLDAETDLKLGSDARIKNMEITKNADKATIDFSKGKVEDMEVKDKITIKGSGDIDTMTVYVSGVTSSIRPDTVKTKDNASKPDYTDDDDDWWTPSRYKNITVTENRNGGTYRNVTVAKENIRVENMNVRENLYIDKAVGEKAVTLRNMSISGNVYVNGGGKDSVYFENCSISGNIYAQKTSGKQVALKFDKNTADKLKGSVVVEGNGALLESTGAKQNVTLKKVTVKTANAVAIGTNVKEMQVTTANTNLTVNGTVDRLQADANVTVGGNGHINEKTGSGQISVSVAGVSLDKTEIVLVEGSNQTLTATVEPTNATNKGVTWSSSNNEIATVNNGVVTAVKEGTATITVTTAEGGKTATCKVTVNAPQTKPVTNVTLEPNTLTLEVGKSETLTAKVEPSDATNQNVKWESNNPDIVTVEQDGTVRAVGVGEAAITAKAGDKTATCTVTVAKADVAVESVTLTPSSLALTVGQEGTLTATVSPDNATDRTVTWESNATNVATVDNSGKVTAVSEGTATITAKAGEQTATCTVTVTKVDVKVTQITISGKNTLNVNETTTLIANVQPGDATNNTVVWTSENPDVVKVENGKVTALMPGQAVIKATAQDGSNTVGMFTIKVNVSNVDTLRTKVATARELMKDIQVSSDGTDVAPTEKWVPQAQKAALDTAVAEADKILTAPLTSQNTVNDAYRDLQTALNAFLNAMKPGTMPNTPMPLSFWDLW